MFISTVIKSEYTHYAYRDNFYMKNLTHALENNWIVITNEFIYKHFFEIQDKVQDRFIKEFEMKRFTPEEFDSIEQYCIPDAIFEDKEREFGSRTEMLFYLTEQSFPALEDCLRGIIEEIKTKHPNEPIEGMFYCAEACQPFRNVCAEYNIPLIPYLFSAYKIPHGYRQTLYYASLSGRLFNSDDCEIGYNKFIKSDITNVPILERRELLALIGKDRTMPLIQLLNHQPKYEMGICCECRNVLPQFFTKSVYTDDDIFYTCKELFDDKDIDVRSHAMHLDMIRVDRSFVRNDPAPFILGCKRLVASRSQILSKVLLWNRVAVSPKNTLPFSFMCEKEFTSEKVADIVAVNYYIFGYLIPSNLMFSREYWEWRMQKPSEVDIYMYHFKYICEQLNIRVPEILEMSGDKRFIYLLSQRNCDTEIIQNLVEDSQDFNVDYKAASSRVVYNTKAHWRLNREEVGKLHFHIEIDENISTLKFYPLDDVAGSAKIILVCVNGKSIEIPSKYRSFMYMSKVDGCFTIDINHEIAKPIIDIYWEYKPIMEFLKEYGE